MLNNFKSNIGENSNIIGVSVSPSVGLEMIEIDKNTGIVNKYSYRPLAYDYSTREIANYNEFKSALISLFDELNISRNSNIVLNLPTVIFGVASLPMMIDEETITKAITSEIEQTYLFKKQKPFVSWTSFERPNSNGESLDILYSAIQKNVQTQIYSICNEIGCNLLAIETSHLSFLKALSFTHIAEEQMRDFVNWKLMIVGQNSYSILSIVGKTIVGYYEEPLVLHTLSSEDIYKSIISSSTLHLTTTPANYLYVVSETDLVSAEGLVRRINFDGIKTYLECNQYAQQSIINSSKNIMPTNILKITPEVIGAGIYDISNFSLRLNLLGVFSQKEENSISYPIINIGNLIIELTPRLIKKLIIIITILLLIIMFITSIVFKPLNNKQKEDYEVVKALLKDKQNEMVKYGLSNTKYFNEKSEITLITAYNKEKIIYYKALGLCIPEHTWITKFKITDNGKVYISGKTSKLEEIYNFYRDLKMSVIDSDIKVYSLESIENEDIEKTNNLKFYNFEITNMDMNEKKEKEQSSIKENEKIILPENSEIIQIQQDNNVQTDLPKPPIIPTIENPLNRGLPPNLEKIENF